MTKETKEETAIALRGQTYPTAEAFGLVLMDLRRKGMNVLTPVTFVQSPPAFHEYALTIVEIDVSPTSREIYHDLRWAKDVFALTHRGLKRLWNAAGGDLTGSERTDNRSIPYFVEWLAEGRIKDLEGEEHSAKKSAHADYRNDSAQVSGWSDKQIMEARRKIVERAESLAQNRVIRELLNLGDSYLLAELKHPFVLAKIVFRPDASDPIVKQFLLERGGRGATALFGPAPIVRTVEYVDAEEPPPAEEPTRVDESAGLDFQAAEADQQVAILKKLIDKKKYDVARLAGPVEKLGALERFSFFEHLMGMPDA